MNGSRSQQTAGFFTCTFALTRFMVNTVFRLVILAAGRVGSWKSVEERMPRWEGHAGKLVIPTEFNAFVNL